jgi:hypothetical protein
MLPVFLSYDLFLWVLQFAKDFSYLIFAKLKLTEVMYILTDLSINCGKLIKASVSMNKTFYKRLVLVWSEVFSSENQLRFSDWKGIFCQYKQILYLPKQTLRFRLKNNSTCWQWTLEQKNYQLCVLKDFLPYILKHTFTSLSTH